MRAGTEATCCWLSAALSQSCCAQTCWLLSTADFTDAMVGHGGVSKAERQSQTMYHRKETHRETHTGCNFTVKPHLSWSLAASLSFWIFLSVCLLRSLRLPQTDWRAWNMQHMYQSQSANTRPAVYHSPGLLEWEIGEEGFLCSRHTNLTNHLSSI